MDIRGDVPEDLLHTAANDCDFDKQPHDDPHMLRHAGVAYFREAQSRYHPYAQRQQLKTQP